MTTTDPRKYLGKTVRYNGQRSWETHKIVDFIEEMDEGEMRVLLVTDQDLCLDLIWGLDYSSDFTVIS